MNAEIYQVSFGQFADMIGDRDDRDIVLSAAKLASEIIVGMFNDKPVCYIGLVPRTLLAPDAYIWLIITLEGKQHPFIIGRYGPEIIKTALLKYTKLYGHCFSEPAAKWLRSLGAEFKSEIEFEIRRA